MAFIDALQSNPRAKRNLWFISLLYPLFPFWGIGLTLASGNPHMMWAPVILIYIIMPIVEMVLGEDKHDILGSLENDSSMSFFHRYMVHMLLPILYITWLGGAWFAATQALPLDAWIALCISHGWGLSFAINSGHEVGHKTDKFSKWMALLMLAPSFYGHFRVEHNQGHHSDVATPRDSATARFGESYWAFLLREIPGAWKRAWRLESKRASRKGYSRFSVKNEVIAASMLSLVLWGSVIAVLGTVAIPYIIATWFISVTALSSQNYIAHYGLLRDQRADGKYLPCQPHHSWNCNLLVTNLVSYNLARHSDHHANPARHYQDLRTFKEAPHLPYGYMPMFILAYFPPLFRRVMDPLVLANVDGDMDKVLTVDKVKAHKLAMA